MRVVLDSTILVSIFSDHDRFHEKALAMYLDIFDEKIEAIVPTLALPETCGLIRRFFGEQLAIMVEDQLMTLIENDMISVKDLTEDRMEKSVESAIRFSIKGGDAIFVSLAEETDAQLATFDDELKKKIKDKVNLTKI